MSNELLQDRINSYFADFGISSESSDKLSVYMGLLRIRDYQTYEHSFRVAELAKNAAEKCNLDINPKPMVFSGLLHDIGKAVVSLNILTKTEGFGEDDMAEMALHPLYGYRMLEGVQDFSAGVIVRHHRFQRNPYPSDEQMPKSNSKFSSNTLNLMDRCALVLGLTDFYDAATHRDNDKFGNQKPHLEQIHSLLCYEYPSHLEVVSKLYGHGVFT